MADAPASSRSVAQLPHWLAPALVALLVLVLAALAIGSARSRAQAEALAATQALARHGAARLAGQLDGIEQYLERAAQHAQVPGAPAWAAPPGIGGVALADAQGRVHARLGPGADAPDAVGAQDFFQGAMAAGPAALVVGSLAARAPAQPPRLVFARALADARGEVQGVAFATAAQTHFDRLFEDLGLWAGGELSLRNLELQPLARWQHGNGQAAGLQLQAALQRAAALAPRQGRFTVVEDGESRLGSYHQLGERPLYLVVSRPGHAAMASWRAHALSLAGLAVLALAGVAALWWGPGGAARRRARQWQARWQALAQAAPAAVFVSDSQGLIQAWGAGAERLFGHARADAEQRPATLLVPPERHGEFARLNARALLGDSVRELETVWQRQDGATLELSLSLSPVLDAQGQPEGVAWVARDLTERKSLLAEVRAMAFHDPLTQLPNRRLLLDRLRQAQLSSNRQRSYYGVLFIDLDGFRHVNDRFGREAGDQLLLEVGRRLQAAVRQHDTVARLGSDEFGLLLEDLGTSEKSAADHVNTVADKVLDAIERVHHLRGELLRCSASIGIRLLVGGQDSPEQVLMDADAAMYRVKRQRLALKAFAFE